MTIGSQKAIFRFYVSHPFVLVCGLCAFFDELIIVRHYVHFLHEIFRDWEIKSLFFIVSVLIL